MGLFDKNQQPSGIRRGLFTSPQANSNLEDIQRQIDNASFRLQQAGVNPNKDNRNWFERATNLPEDQNWFFDTLDIIGRPFQAVSNPLESLLQGDTNNLLGESWEGFSGKDKVYGSDLVDAFGWEVDENDSFLEKAAHWTTGFAGDVVLDPLNVLGVGAVRGTIGTGARTVGNAGKSTASSLFSKLPQQAQDGLSQVGEGLSQVGRGAKSMIGGRYANMTNAERDLAQSFDNSAKYWDGEITRDAADLIRNIGGDATEIAKLQEAALQINKTPEELLSEFMKKEGYSSNVIKGEYKNFIDDFNKYFSSLPEIQQRATKVNSSIRNETSKVNAIFNKYGKNNFLTQFRALMDNATNSGIDLANAVKNQDNMKAAGFTKDQFEFLTDVRTLLKTNNRIKVLKGDLDKIQTPLVTRQLDSGSGFVTENRRPGLSRAYVNPDEMIEAVSPKKSFNDMLGVSASVVRPTAEELLSEGKVTLKLDDPSVNELKRLFGDDIKVRRQKNTTVTLTNKDILGTRLDDMQFTDRIENVNVPRPERELTNDANMVNAARLLTDGYEDMRKLAQSHGLDYNKLAGYMKHILSQEAEKLKQPKVSMSGKSRVGGNKATVRSRNYDGSVLDINERLGFELMDPNAYFASAIGRKKLSEYIHAEGFKNEVLNQFARKYQPGMNVGKNEVIIKPENYQFFQTEGGQLAIKAGEEYVVSKPMKQALDNWKKKIDDEGINAFVKTMDFLNNQFKRLALFSAAFHIRNIVGSHFNMWISGMNAKDIGKYNIQALNDLRIGYRDVKVTKRMNVPKPNEQKARQYFDEFRKQGLNESSIFDNDFVFKDPRKALEDRVKYEGKGLFGKGLHRFTHPFETSRDIGMSADRVARYALFRWAREKKGMSPKEAAAKVREVLFDYSDLSPFERGLRHAVPFYTWMRKNAEFQIKNLITQPQKYGQVERIRQDALDNAGIEDEKLPEWLKTSMAMPIGDNKLAGLNLPISDLAQMAEDNPFGMLVNGLTPYAKLPIEFTTNYDMFRGKPIEEFEGQTGMYGMSKNMEHFINSLSGSLGTTNRKLNSDNFNLVNDVLLGGIVKENDPQQNEVFHQLGRLKELEDLMKVLQQETGSRPKTIRELEQLGITR